MKPNGKPILVIGGGIAGMTAAVEAAEVGYDVILVEKEAFLGGRTVRTYQYFPKMCPPTCGFEINARRIRQNPRITVHTLATVEEVTGEPGGYTARIKVRPRYVTTDHGIDERVLAQLTSERWNDFNLGMDRTKAVYLPHDMAYPHRYMIDKEALSDADAAVLAEALPAGAIDLEQEEVEIEAEVGAVILATGWRPYDAANLDNLGFGRFKNVITNVMMERLAARGGPTGGEIVRPSDKAKAMNVAFVQCAGSRDEKHLPYCSSVCCMGSLKQVRFLRQKNPGAKATVFYIDIRTIGYLEKFYFDLLDEEGVTFVKGKVAALAEVAGTGNLSLDVEDTLAHETLHDEFDLVVLATGVVPNTDGLNLPEEVVLDAYGFVDESAPTGGIFAAGCVKRPCDVSRTTKDATASALRAIQCIKGRE